MGGDDDRYVLIWEVVLGVSIVRGSLCGRACPFGRKLWDKMRMPCLAVKHETSSTVRLLYCRF